MTRLAPPNSAYTRWRPKPGRNLFRAPSRRPDNLETLHLSLELLKRIPRQRKIDSRELQSQLKEAGYDRDMRTIQRQLESLCQHFDIERRQHLPPVWLPLERGCPRPVTARLDRTRVAVDAAGREKPAGTVACVADEGHARLF